MLEKLKEYKELIAIIVFFLGGFFWLESQFPTKSDIKVELASLHCLLEKYMTLTQLQIRSQELEKQSSELKRRVSEMSPEDASRGGLPVSPAMKLEYDQLKSDLDGRRKDLQQTTDEMAKLRDELARQVCGKVTL